MSDKPDISPEVAEAIKTYLTDIAEGRCSTCHQPVQERESIGRCIYAKPCGHRLYSGVLSKKGKKQ